MDIALELVNQRVKECVKFSNKYYGSNVRKPAVQFMKNATVHAGLAYGMSYIKLSKYFFNYDAEWMLEEIIPHEVAHIVHQWFIRYGWTTDKNVHGDSWKQIAIDLGATGLECPVMPETCPHPEKFLYKTSTGRVLYLPEDKHDAIQNFYKVYRDRRDGGTVIAASFIRKGR